MSMADPLKHIRGQHQQVTEGLAEIRDVLTELRAQPEVNQHRISELETTLRNSLPLFHEFEQLEAMYEE